MKTVQMPNYEERKILIWGMTYPELSDKYVETVCTGGVFEDGTPVRLYPIPYRYLDHYLNTHERFHKYQWITAGVMSSRSDTRPETYKIDPSSIVLGPRIPSNSSNEWAARADVVFSNKEWQFESMDELIASHERTGRSLGVLTPREILDVRIMPRSPDDAASFREKLQKIKQRQEVSAEQVKFFEETTPPEIMKDLDFPQYRMQIHWKCGSSQCGKPGHAVHKMQVMDWEMIELQRRVGADQARYSLVDFCDLDTYAMRFYVGSLFTHPSRFTIVGLWYPKRVEGMLHF
jgi:hypothetical protein